MSDNINKAIDSLQKVQKNIQLGIQGLDKISTATETMEKAYVKWIQILRVELKSHGLDPGPCPTVMDPLKDKSTTIGGIDFIIKDK